MKTAWKKVFPVVAGILCLFMIASVSVAGHPEISRISIDELKKLMDAKADVIILDVQLKEQYDKGHIRGALSLPWKAEVTDTDVEGLAKDKLIVTYCDCGPGEADSSDLANQLLGLGFANVKVLADPAIRGWKKAAYPMQ
ncbi:MAG: rhodanese-like domain-containing protein [Syntrophales bacterium]|nr:rhodanese-like domain-containing protein [Syntrophales bacterium]